MVIGLVVLAILAVALAWAVLNAGDPGIGGDPTGSPTPSSTTSGSVPPPASGSGTATGTPGASASAVPSEDPGVVVDAPDGILPVGAVAEVTADGLRIREEPSTSTAIVGTVNAGEVVHLVMNANFLGPIEADGFDWYLVQHAPGWRDWPANPPGEGDGPSGDPRIVGWIAAASESEAFLSLSRADCPDQIDIATLWAHTAWERLSCLGDQQITVEGTYGCGGCGGLAPGTFEPEWLAHPLNFHAFSPPWADRPAVVEGMTLSIPPDVPPLGSDQAGSVLRVRGHFNDPRSTECSIAPGEPGAERAADELAAEWYCRLQFVVESWEVVGTDPDYQAS
jgi:hypothetical protein